MPHATNESTFLESGESTDILSRLSLRFVASDVRSAPILVFISPSGLDIFPLSEASSSAQRRDFEQQLQLAIPQVMIESYGAILFIFLHPSQQTTKTQQPMMRAVSSRWALGVSGGNRAPLNACPLFLVMRYTEKKRRWRRRAIVERVHIFLNALLSQSERTLDGPKPSDRLIASTHLVAVHCLIRGNLGVQRKILNRGFNLYFSGASWPYEYEYKYDVRKILPFPLLLVATIFHPSLCVLTKSWLRTSRVQENQTHSSILQTLWIPNMLLLYTYFVILILLLCNLATLHFYW